MKLLSLIIGIMCMYIAFYYYFTKGKLDAIYSLLLGFMNIYACEACDE